MTSEVDELEINPFYNALQVEFGLEFTCIYPSRMTRSRSRSRSRPLDLDNYRVLPVSISSTFYRSRSSSRLEEFFSLKF